MRRLVVRVFAVLFVVSALGIGHAQSPIPGGVRVGDGWVPCDHPIAVAAGKGCVVTLSAPLATINVAPSEGQCVTFRATTICRRDQCAGHIDAYTQSEWATACAHYTAQFYVPPPAPVFRIGQHVRHAYGLRAVVIGITKTLAGAEVIVLEITESHSNVEVGDLMAFTNGSGVPWFEYQR